MPRITTVDDVLTILSILGEEDTAWDFEQNEEVQDAIATLQGEIIGKINAGIITIDTTVLIDQTKAA